MPALIAERGWWSERQRSCHRSPFHDPPPQKKTKKNDMTTFGDGNFSVALAVTVDVFKPVFNATTKVPVPTSVRPAFLGIHGGSYSHGDSSMEYGKTSTSFFSRRC